MEFTSLLPYKVNVFPLNEIVLRVSFAEIRLPPFVWKFRSWPFMRKVHGRLQKTLWGNDFFTKLDIYSKVTPAVLSLINSVLLIFEYGQSGQLWNIGNCYIGKLPMVTIVNTILWNRTFESPHLVNSDEDWGTLINIGRNQDSLNLELFTVHNLQFAGWAPITAYDAVSTFVMISVSELVVKWCWEKWNEHILM